MGDHLADYLVPGVKLEISNVVISHASDDEFGLAAPKQIELSQLCECVIGSLGPIDHLGVSFDYAFDYDDLVVPIRGTALVNLHNLMVEYKVVPKLFNS